MRLICSASSRTRVPRRIGDGTNSIVKEVELISVKRDKRSIYIKGVSFIV